MTMPHISQILTKQNSPLNSSVFNPPTTLCNPSTKIASVANKKLQDNEQTLFAIFNPSEQLTLSRNHYDCFFGSYPTLAALNHSPKYAPRVAERWLVVQLTNFSEYIGARNKLSDSALSECAARIAQNFFYLKVSEILLFFSMLKDQHFGDFYGSVDPLKILSALRRDFLSYRAHFIDTHKPDTPRPAGISRSQHFARVQAALSGDTDALLHYAPAAQSSDPAKIRQFLLHTYPNLNPSNPQ